MDLVFFNTVTPIELLFVNTLYEIGKNLHSSKCGFCSLGNWSYSKE